MTNDRFELLGYFGEEEDSRSDIRIGKPFLFHVVHDKSNKNSKLPEDLCYYSKPIHGVDTVIDTLYPCVSPPSQVSGFLPAKN